MGSGPVLQCHTESISRLRVILAAEAAGFMRGGNKSLGGKSLEINIKAPKEGSVLVDLVTIVNQVNSLIPDLSHVATLMGVVGGVYGIHKFISGKKIKEAKKEERNVKLTLDDNSTMTVAENIYNIYVGTPSIPNGISQHFSALNEDPAVTDFKVIKENKEVIIDVERKDYARLAIKQQFETENSKTVLESAHLYIYKVVFDKTDRKWEFYYNGNRISASIADDAFFKKIDGGESFSKGDQLRVDLQINQIKDESVGVFVNQSYQVVKVNEHIKRSVQRELPFDKRA